MRIQLSKLSESLDSAVATHVRHLQEELCKINGCKDIIHMKNKALAIASQPHREITTAYITGTTTADTDALYLQLTGGSKVQLATFQE